MQSALTLGALSGFDHLQAAHGAGAGSEMVGFDPEPLEDVYKEVWQWIVSVAVEDQMLAMPETAARKEDGQIGRHVGIRVAEVAAIEYHRAVQQGFIALSLRFQVREEACQQFHMFTV